MKRFIQKNKFIYKLLFKSRDLLRIIYNQKRRSRFFWNLRNGDEKLSLDYDFTNKSIVFDVGTYIGSFTEKIVNRFDCNVYAFEPKNEYFNYLTDKFKKNNNVKIFNFALSNFTGTAQISDIGAGSSIIERVENSDYETINVVSFVDFLKMENIDSIDLLYLNIEGSEYDLFTNIFENNYQDKINHFQIQFHNFVNQAKQKRSEIRKVLKITHECKFNFPFIWERWDKKI
tara:strand:+ start:3652 stop:4341 length:690 start_codon:yes stop_codon:yes gene_type:complete